MCVHVPLSKTRKVSCQFEIHHIYKKEVILMEYKIK